MFPSAPVNLADLVAFTGAGSVTLGTAWFLVRLAKAVVPWVVDYLLRRRLLRIIERLATAPPPARIEVTSQGFVFDPCLDGAPVGRPGSAGLFAGQARPP